MKIQLRAKGISLVLLAVSIASMNAFAQVPTGTILGTVRDAQGLSMAGATVTLANEGTAQTLTDKTSSLGVFQFSHLNAGVYQIEVSSPGFKNSDVTGIKLDASTEYSVPPIVLQVGAITDTISVEADANLVRTAGAELTDTVTREQIQELPILDRDPIRLLSLQAGVAQNNRSGAVVNGLRSSFNNLTLDGINIQDDFERTGVNSGAVSYTPNLLLMSQVGEFTTTTQNAGVQAGLGTSQVSLVTPSGTNSLHGEGFWYYKTGAWAANDWFNNAEGVGKPNLLQNQGGGDIGGPVIKNKLFIYGAYELLRLKQQVPVDTVVLTNSARNGIFQWRNTSSGAVQCARVVVVPSVAVPPGCGDLTSGGSPSLDPVIASMLARVPTTINNPTMGDGLNTSGYTFNQRYDRSRDNTSVRLDWDASAHHSFSGTYAWNRDWLDRPGETLGLADTYGAVPSVYNDDKINFLSTAWRWSPTSNFTNEVRFGFDLAPINFLTNQKFGAFTVSNTVFNTPDQNEFPSNRKAHTWSWQDNASRSYGNHLLSFGIQVQRVTLSTQNYYNTVPNLNLDYTQGGSPAILGSGSFAGQGGILSSDMATANQLLSTLGGLVGSESQTFNVTSRTSGYVPGAPLAQNFRYNNWSLYAGDSWKLRRNLTLTYGLRWEYNSPFDERDGLMEFPQVANGQSIQQALLSNATLGYFGGNSGQRVYRKDLNNFAPNLGIAWDPFGDGKTSIRAGYSFSYVNDELISAPYNASLSNPGVSVQTGQSLLSSATVSNPKTIPTPGIFNTFAGNFANLYGSEPATNFGYAVDPNLRTPYVQQWNLSIQREIGWDTSVTVSYIGNKGTKLYRAIDLNQVQINNNGFLQAFNLARQNGFKSLSATGVFDPCYTPSGSNCGSSNPNVAYFANNFLFGNLGFYFPGLVNQYIQQGAVGELANLYHELGSDSSALFNMYYGIPAPVSLAPNQYLEAADLLGNYSSSSYNAGSVEIRRRFRSGLNFQGSYTFSKVFTDYSADTNTDVERFSPYLDNANPGLERARANFDLTHAFKANFRYELPFGDGHSWAPTNRLISKLVSGWATSSIFTWQSGAPFSILSGLGTLNRSARSTLTNTAYTTSSPQQIAGQLGVFQQPNGEVLLIDPKYIGSDGRGVPADALTCTPLVAGGFCNPAPGTVGNLPRNAFNGPSYFNWDLAILKSIPISESKTFEYRLEMFNALNHPTFAVGNPAAGITDMNINDPNFGVAISTASTARVIQMGLRFAF
jgi:hypothetical protein